MPEPSSFLAQALLVVAAIGPIASGLFVVLKWHGDRKDKGMDVYTTREKRVMDEADAIRKDNSESTSLLMTRMQAGLDRADVRHDDMELQRNRAEAERDRMTAQARWWHNAARRLWHDQANTRTTIWRLQELNGQPLTMWQKENLPSFGDEPL